MIPVVDFAAYLERLVAAPRPHIDAVLAYYEHRVGAIVTGGNAMLAPLDDHMFHRGDGVFEAIKFVDGKIYQFEEHLARMQRSAGSIRLAPPCPWEEIRDITLQTVKAAGVTTGHLRLFLGRGPGGFGVDPAECPTSSFYVVVSRFTPKPESWYEQGLTGFRTSIPAKAAHLSKIKDTNYLTAVLMTMEGHDKGKEVPFCFDAEGCLAESAVANICLVDRAGVMVVPEFKHALPGTTIRRAMALLQGKVSTIVRPVPESDIYEAAEVLMLGTSPNCVSVVEYEGKTIGKGRRGPVSRLLYELIEQDIRENGFQF